MSYQQQLCTFRVDGTLYGIEVEKVQEVIRFQPLTPVPRSPHAVKGLINLRGEIVAAVDAREALDLDPVTDGSLPTNVVVRWQGGTTSLLVDDVADVLTVDTRTMQPPPDHLKGPRREVLRGVFQLETDLLLVLDLEPFLDNVATAP